MPTDTDVFLAHYEAAARRGEREEREFRDNYFSKLAELERVRILANRRSNLLSTTTRAIEGMAEDENARDLVALVLENEVGLSRRNPQHAIVIDRFHLVTDAILESLAPDSHFDVNDGWRTVEEFETWYRERTGQEFFALRDIYVQETPRVDF